MLAAIIILFLFKFAEILLDFNFVLAPCLMRAHLVTCDGSATRDLGPRLVAATNLLCDL